MSTGCEWPPFEPKVFGYSNKRISTHQCQPDLLPFFCQLP
ncbi:hypothetical protein LEMLEM_LOCUS15117 [Lemmus lemmus]